MSYSIRHSHNCIRSLNDNSEWQYIFYRARHSQSCLQNSLHLLTDYQIANTCGWNESLKVYTNYCICFDKYINSAGCSFNGYYFIPAYPFHHLFPAFTSVFLVLLRLGCLLCQSCYVRAHQYVWSQFNLMIHPLFTHQSICLEEWYKASLQLMISAQLTRMTSLEKCIYRYTVHTA